jgi:hypothetical protein
MQPELQCSLQASREVSKATSRVHAVHTQVGGPPEMYTQNGDCSQLPRDSCERERAGVSD